MSKCSTSNIRLPNGRLVVYEAALDLAGAGAEVMLIGRNAEGAAALQKLKGEKLKGEKS